MVCAQAGVSCLPAKFAVNNIQIPFQADDFSAFLKSLNLLLRRCKIGEAKPYIRAGYWKPGVLYQGILLEHRYHIFCKHTKICTEKELFLPFCCVDCRNQKRDARDAGITNILVYLQWYVKDIRKYADSSGRPGWGGEVHAA